MLVLLPPSEGKTPARRGRPVDLAAVSNPELTAARVQVLDALAAASAAPDAPSVLDVPPTLGAEIARNVLWRSAPAQRVSSLYSGVLYDALDLASLPVGARRRAATRLLVVSAAWGALRTSDRVPAYRVSMDVALPGVGPLAAHWRRHLGPVLDELAAGRLVVDCRSSTYAAAWRPGAAQAPRTVAVRVLQEQAGRRTVVSHMAKHTRGLVARHLLERDGSDPRTPDALARALAERWVVELGPPARSGASVLDVVVPAPGLSRG